MIQLLLNFIFVSIITFGIITPDSEPSSWTNEQNSSHNLPSFNQCSDQKTAQLEAQVAAVVEQLRIFTEKTESLQETMTLLARLQLEEFKEKLEDKEKQAEHQKLKQQSKNAQNEQHKAIIQHIENAPWYERYSIQALAILIPFVQNILLPEIKRNLIHMITRKIVHEGLSCTDYVLGDLVEKILSESLSKCIATRPGEWLQVDSSEQRVLLALKRNLGYDPEICALKQELNKLDPNFDFDSMKSKERSNLETKILKSTVDNSAEIKKLEAELKILKETHFDNLVKERMAKELAEKIATLNAFAEQKEKAEAKRQDPKNWHVTRRTQPSSKNSNSDDESVD